MCAWKLRLHSFRCPGEAELATADPKDINPHKIPQGLYFEMMENLIFYVNAMRNLSHPEFHRTGIYQTSLPKRSNPSDDNYGRNTSVRPIEQQFARLENIVVISLLFF